MYFCILLAYLLSLLKVATLTRIHLGKLNNKLKSFQKKVNNTQHTIKICYFLHQMKQQKRETKWCWEDLKLQLLQHAFV